jgi:carbon monoxide dehydrogenase subunit G
MEFTGRYVIPARPEDVWTALNDPDILKSCIAGCERMAKTNDTHFEAAVTLKIGPMKATFKGNVTLTDLEPPHRATLKGEGQGGVAGFAKGEAEIVLTPEDGGTVLTYAAKASIGGKLAQIGQRLIDGAAKQIADDFFSRFAASVGSPTISPEAAILAGTAPELAKEVLPPNVAESSSPRQGLAPEIWVVGLIGVIVILLVLFGVTL